MKELRISSISRIYYEMNESPSNNHKKGSSSCNNYLYR